ncbi:hypothetical protein B0T24DRAFT_666999 [Lasiosphaeria ovina]|uniref:Factor arrest protein 11 n=1 Tax=Lasiosphaeria ovina TaxID=92902 RepID=A0AAE0N875_9PEZI|nr:hypothetical protein B0T24DRAFT_666999 [Lasiosphaeria ovina]
MNALWSSRASGDGAAGERESESESEKPPAEGPDASEPQVDTPIEQVGPDPSLSSSSSSSSTPLTPAPSSAAASSSSPAPRPNPQNIPNLRTAPNARPGLQRNQSAPQVPPPGVPPPAPAPPPPPPPPPQASGADASSNPPDSLSLAQLRRIVAEFPRTEPIAYDYVYEDMGPIDEEIDEWFMYNFWQWVRLNAANRAFHGVWARLPARDYTWDEAGREAQQSFVREALASMQSPDKSTRGEAIGALVYLVLGRWTETVRAASMPNLNEGKVKSAATKVQLDAIRAGVQLLSDCDGIPVIWDALKSAFEPFWHVTDEHPQNLQVLAEELIHLMTIMYMALQVALDDPDGVASVHSELLALNPNLVHFMLHATARLRWDEACILPQTQVFLFFFKSILLVFGGSKEIADTKKATSETQNDDGEKSTITASPLDYHVFRQEITSKYPAYIPPQPAIPLEAEQTSLLPQLPNHPTRDRSTNGILPGPPGQSGGASILHQPVHIATPAPSPPPSPGPGGKGGKKQNYQTNQNFPFMYPPLDATSNSAGGKGGAGLQDLLVGRKWEGSDVPASILEAGELFSRRVRMPRATRQLWDEREKFLKFERGWDGEDNDIVDELDLSSLTLEEKEELGLLTADEQNQMAPEPEVDYGPRELDERTKERLRAVESFYSEALPHLQSLVIVLLKAVVAIASSLVPPPPPNGQQHPAAAGQNNQRLNGGGPGAGRQDAANGHGGAGKGELSSPSENDVDEARSREIAAKAVTGVMILLLKWLKLSHVLKFEYMTQLLLDSNYLPLVLKLFALQDVQQVVESKTDRIEQSFFYFCGSRAGAILSNNVPNPTTTEFEEDISEEEDEAAPPPIKRRRSPQRAGFEEGEAAAAAPAGEEKPTTRPEVDELGYPVNPLPKEPITEFSRRNFFTLINYLRVMQKICKHKAHRNLLMVNYKSSNILRKSLKVPQQELRLYTLKLFKNQVPYCGRKWRQSNMRVITAVYLHCRPELRDEWLAGSDVDAEVEEALPLEQALRSLTHWFNMRRYPDKMAPEVRQALREEQDFFVRELDKVDLNWDAMADGDDSSVRLEWSDQDPSAAWG